MKDYGQASGRGGRDGLMSRAIIIRGGHDFGDELVARYMDRARRQCRRIDIDRYLDGDVHRQRCVEGEEACDICAHGGEDGMVEAGDIGADGGDEMVVEEDDRGEGAGSDVAPRGRPEVTWSDIEAIGGGPGGSSSPRPTAGRVDQGGAMGNDEVEWARRGREWMREQDRERHMPQQRRTEQERAAAQWWEALGRQLDRWKRICVICRQAGRPACHAVTDCTSVEGRMAEKFRRQARSGASFSPGKVCYHCAMPKTMCERWAEGGAVGKSGGVCQWYGVMFAVVCGVKFAYEAIWEEWMQREVVARAGMRLNSGREVGMWLSRDDGSGEMRGPRLGKAFMWMTQRMEQEERAGAEG